ncbi:phytanoyl-CoA dioxygenase family protein [Paremcibacter congregatus]|uniref:phytanoyl-CoA dioxygenase family protein n=1 Tax=Paremcibacter congregatus TaxID=2043170 RepID=UPI0030EB5718
MNTQMYDFNSGQHQYQDRGYCVLPQIFTPEEVSALLQELDILQQAGGGADIDRYRDDTGLLRRMERLYDKAPRLREMNGRMAGLLKDLFGSEMTIFKDKYNVKPPRGEGFYAHYDGIFQWRDAANRVRRGWYEYADEFYNVLLALDPCTPDNGPLEVAARHDGGFETLLRNTRRNGTPELTERVAAQADFEKILLSPGDVVIFSHRCPHRSAVNATDRSRRIIYYTYNKAVDGDYYAAYFRDKATSNKGSPTSKALSRAG